MNITTARTGIASLIDQLDLGVLALPYDAEDAKSLPAAMVGMPEVIEYVTSTGRDRAVFPITVLVSKANPEASQAQLDTLLSRGEEGNFIDALVGAARAEFGVLRVLTAGEFGEYTIGAEKLLGAVVRVELNA